MRRAFAGILHTAVCAVRSFAGSPFRADRLRAFEGGEEARAAGGGQRRRSVYFPPRPPRKGGGPLCIAKQNKRPSCRPPLRFGRAGFAGAVQPPPAPPATSLAIKAAIGGLTIFKETTMTTLHDIDADFGETRRDSSATAGVIDGLELYGYQPSAGEPDPRPLPDAERLGAVISDIFDILAGTLQDTSLEPDLDDLLWSLTDLFHKKAARVERQLGDNEDRQKRSQQEQDGSEIRSVELETLIRQGQAHIERRDAFEQIRDLAAERYETATGSAWRPRAGSLVNHRHLTAAMIDSRDFIAARRSADTELLLPKGTKIAFAGGVDYANHKRIWAVLDKVLAKHADMVLIHGGTPKGAERAAACWADSRKVAQIAFKPDWKCDGKAAPFKRNDRMLDVVPAGVIIFPGSGITGNLADKAKKLGIPVLDHREGGA